MLGNRMLRYLCRSWVALFAVLATGFACAAAAAPSFVQAASQSGSAARSTSTAAFTAAQTAGNVNVVFIAWKGAATSLISVMDSAGNAYTKAGAVSYGTTATQAVYYTHAIVGVAASANTVTATFNTKVNNPDLRIVEYTGINAASPLDAYGGLGSAAALTSSGAVATTSANDLLLASNFSQQSITAAGAGFTLRLTDQYAQIVEDETVTVVGKYTATAPQTKSGWFLMQLVALRAVAALTPVPVLVPNVVGQSTSAASTALTTLGLVAGITQQSSATVAAGNVISQQPAAGMSVVPGTSVSLTVSSGPSTVSVPNVSGQTQSAAGAALAAVGLTVGAVTQQSSGVAVGSVISSAPAAGVSVSAGSAVNLVISSGAPSAPSSVSVPNLVGQTQSTAVSLLSASGLVLGSVTQQASGSVPSGSVVSSTPAAGSSVAGGSSVALAVSTGSPAIPPPVVVGPYPQSTILAGISWNEASKQRYASGSDIWDSAWASDGFVYGVWGDGNGFTSPAKKQIGVSQLGGSPDAGPLTGRDVYLGSPSPRIGGCTVKSTLGGKPHGTLALPNAVIYMFHSTYDLCTNQAWLARSLDNGITWTDNVGGIAWPDANGFNPVAILQYGAAQTGALMPDATFVPYVYIYGSETNGVAGAQYLARVAAFPSNAIETPANWSYFAGADASGNPLWVASSAQAAPVWTDANNSESIGVSFDAALGRYLAYNDHGNACGGSPCERQVSLFDAPSPWGPWTTFDYEENFDNANCGSSCLGSQEAVGWAMMQKWFSADGLSFWVEYSSVNAYDSLNLIKGTMTLATSSSIDRLSISTATPAVLDRLGPSGSGNLEFIDSPARLSYLPASYVGDEVIRLARNDAAVADPGYVSFNNAAAQNVCVAWNTANVLPPWLAGWNATGQTLVGDATFAVYSMAYPAGPVTLPGANAADAYILFVGCN